MQQQTSDEQLYAAYQQGDMAAFDLLYARYRQSLYLFLLRRGHTATCAEDVFHDCWIRIIENRQTFDGANFRAWVFRITRNLSTDRFRRQQHHAEQEMYEADLSQHHVSTQKVQQEVDCLQLMKNALTVLPVEQRDVFLLKEEGGLSLQQIADVMALGRETIKSRLRYAMGRLKQLMEECL